MRTWRLFIVVRPNESFSLAYSSLPTLIKLVSSKRTTVASTFCLGKPGCFRSCCTCRRIDRQHRSERDHPAELSLIAHLSIARVVSVLLASARVPTHRLQMSVG